jgi:hypothetical protein
MILSSSNLVCISFSDQLKRSEEEKLTLVTTVQQLQGKFPFQSNWHRWLFGIPGAPVLQKAFIGRTRGSNL